MSTTNEASAINRLLKFNLELNTTTTYKLLKLTPGSYYKIILREGNDTSIIEVLNNKIYTVCTPSEKYFKLEKDIFYIKGFSGAITLFIDYYEKFELLVEEDSSKQPIFSEEEKESFCYYTEGVTNYLGNFSAETFKANSLTVDASAISSISANAIKIGNWKVKVAENNDGTPNTNKLIFKYEKETTNNE